MTPIAPLALAVAAALLTIALAVPRRTERDAAFSRRAPGHPAAGTVAAVAVAFLAACGGDGGDGAQQAAGEAGAEAAGADSVVDVYSHRHYPSDQELYDRFTEETGIEVNVVTGSADQLITRLATEGEGTPADVLITVDAGRLHRARSQGLLQPVSSDTLEARVPEPLRHPEGYWYGLTRRSRIIAYARDRVSEDELPTYEELADDRWEGEVLVRSSENVYNQSLLASLVAHHGEEAAREWAQGVVDNMARAPQGGDTDQVMGVAAGVGDLAIVNHYYVARLKTSDDPEEQRVGEAVGVHFPNQDGRGAHVNVSGAGVTAAADDPEAAVRLLEFLTSHDAQRMFAQATKEFPVNPDVEPTGLLRSWAGFRADTLNLSVLGEQNERAVRIFGQVGWQ
ncbi:MAG: Fe(3+) ABC transporter substrate-binding protein [Candidatus Palauibacterales bacterium]|nr:Fe(3+) ABC transporter substrate-binding protein [Candidatus Palauibacterales bacterium]